MRGAKAEKNSKVTNGLIITSTAVTNHLKCESQAETIIWFDKILDAISKCEKEIEPPIAQTVNIGKLEPKEGYLIIQFVFTIFGNLPF